MSKWKPIGTAPKDGTDILCICMWTAKGCEDHMGHMEVDCYKDRYHGFGKFNNNSWPATHWMPLPSPPTPNTTLDEQERSA